MLSAIAVLSLVATQVAPPVLEQFVAAEYPEGATATATVTLALEIGIDGRVSKVQVAQSAGHEGFDRAAVEAAGQLIFRPATVDGMPAVVRILFRYVFTPPLPETSSLAGIVTDKEGAPLEGVLVELATTSTVTGDGGRFSFDPIEPGHHPLRFSRGGFVTLTVEKTVGPGEHIELTGRLEALEATAAIDEEEVVRAPRVRRELAKARIGGAEARKVPGTQGDTVKVVEAMGGVGRAAAGSGELVIWGASPSDTRSYIDGILVPRLFHLGGSRSIFASELVSSVELIPGGYGVQYGRAVGGLIRVETATPPEESGVHGYAALDLIDASLGARAHLGDHWSIAAAGRKSLLEQTFGAFADEQARRLIPIPSYWDYQLQAIRTPSSGERLNILIFGSDDFIAREAPSADPALDTREEARIAFHRAGLRYQRLLPDGSSIEVVPWFGFDRSERTSNFSGIPAAQTQTTYRAALRASERRRFTSLATLESGLDLEGTHAIVDRRGALTLPAREGDIVVFGLPPGDRVNADGWEVSLGGIGAHSTLELSLFDGALMIEPGIRFELTLLDGDRVVPVRGREPSIGYTESFATFDPRLRVSWRMTDELAIHGALGLYHQPADAADLSPVFGSPVLELVRGVHSVLGAKLAFGATELEVTGFLVQLSSMPVRSPFATPPLASALVSTGEGRNLGAQIGLKHRFSDALYGWVTYSLMRALRRDRGDVPWRFFDADQTHNLTVVASWAVGAGFELGARFRFASGFPRTPVVGAYYNARSGAYDPVFGAQNTMRLPAFIDLSVRAGYTRDLGWAKLELFLDVQNVINRRNPEEILYSSDFAKSELISGTPVLPVFGARLEL